MQSYSQLSEFDFLLDLDLDLWPRPFKNESLPDLNVAINPWKFHHSTTKIVVRKLFTNKQTNRGENNTSPTSLAEVISYHKYLLFPLDSSCWHYLILEYIYNSCSLGPFIRFLLNCIHSGLIETIYNSWVADIVFCERLVNLLVFFQ